MPVRLLYLVMEYVQGTDVAQMIRASDKLPPEDAYAVIANVCEALACSVPIEAPSAGRNNRVLKRTLQSRQPDTSHN